MRLTRYFLPVLKENPAEAQIVSHRYMLRAGMIKQQAAGIYSWLPLGFQVLKRIEQIVHEEQQRAGHIPLLMPTLQPADLWRESGRYDDYGQEMLRIRDRQDREMLYGPTNEEMITDIFRSARDQLQGPAPDALPHPVEVPRRDAPPLRRHARARVPDEGRLQLRHRQEAALHAYNRHMVSYLRTYERMGLTAIPMRAASGPIGGDNTHEFLVLASTGESEVFYDSAVTEPEARRPRRGLRRPRAGARHLRRVHLALRPHRRDARRRALRRRSPRSAARSGRGIEVGQIFYFGTKYSEPMGATVTTAERRARARRRWARTGSASRASWARSSRPATTTRASSGPRA